MSSFFFQSRIIELRIKLPKDPPHVTVLGISKNKLMPKYKWRWRGIPLKPHPIPRKPEIRFQMVKFFCGDGILILSGAGSSLSHQLHCQYCFSIKSISFFVSRSLHSFFNLRYKIKKDHHERFWRSSVK